MKRFLFSVILLVFLCHTIIPTVAHATTYTTWEIDYDSISIDSYDSFRKAVINNGYNVDGYYGCQCWDGAVLLWKKLGMFLHTAYSYYQDESYSAGVRTCWEYSDVRASNAGDMFSLIWSVEDIQRGDIIVFGGSGTGHIGFADESYSSGMEKIKLLAQNQTDANFETGHPFDVKENDLGNFLGAFRYKNWKSNSPSTNLGDDFYAFIIYKEAWRHLENASRNVQVAQNGRDASDPRQIWHFLRQSNGTYKIINEYDGRCLDAANWGTSNGTNIGVTGSNDTTAQRWYVYGGDGSYTIKASYCDLVMDVSGGGTPGSNVQLYQKNSGVYQVFSIYGLSNDGVNYASMKPSAPAKPTISTSVDNGSVTVTWTESPVKNKFDNRTYDIQIFSGSTASGSPVYAKTGLSTRSISTSLAAGTYTVRIRSINTKYENLYSDNTKSFTVTPATISVTLNKSTLPLTVGDSETLTATVLPSNATDKTVTWSSRDAKIATVDASGKVTGVAPGKTTITASAGGKSATCTVEVSPKSEYGIGEIEVYSADGTALTSIPAGEFLATVPITKLSEGHNALVFLAAYNAAGQYRGLMYVKVKNAPLHATVEITLPVDNRSGDIAQLKAIVVSSIGSLTPIGPARSFPESV